MATAHSPSTPAARARTTTRTRRASIGGASLGLLAAGLGRDGDDDAPGAERLLRPLLHAVRGRRAIALQILVDESRIAREIGVVVQRVRPSLPRHQPEHEL